jgi:hypothetical protein
MDKFNDLKPTNISSNKIPFEQGKLAGSMGMMPVYYHVPARVGYLGFNSQREEDFDFSRLQRPVDFLEKSEKSTFRHEQIAEPGRDEQDREKNRSEFISPKIEPKKEDELDISLIMKDSMTTLIMKEYMTKINPYQINNFKITPEKEKPGDRLTIRPSGKYNNSLASKKISNFDSHLKPRFDPKEELEGEELERLVELETEYFRKGYRDGLTVVFMPEHGIGHMGWLQALEHLNSKRGIAVYSKGLQLQALQDKDRYNDNIDERVMDIIFDTTPNTTELYRLGVVVRIARDYGIVLQKFQVPTDAESIAELRKGLGTNENPLLDKKYKDSFKNPSIEDILLSKGYKPESLRYSFGDKRNIGATSKEIPQDEMTAEFRAEVSPGERQKWTGYTKQSPNFRELECSVEAFKPENPEDYRVLGQRIRKQGEGYMELQKIFIF